MGNRREGVLPARLLVKPSLKAAAQRNAVIVGHDFETGERKFIADDARRAGLYVLGRSGTGKSTLLLHLLDQDIQNGHGVFFLDPHGDAIEELVAQHCSYAPARAGTGRAGGLGVLSCDTRLNILNPENEAYSFGINLLACKNPASRSDYRNTYNRAYSVFRKIWEIEWEKKPWLQKITQHTIYAFIESPELTLAEVPMFLDLQNPDYTPFREYVVGNIKQNEAVADFWRFLFRAKGLEDQQREVDAALTRVQILLADPDVRDIVGQQETTVDFAETIENKRVLLLKLSAHLAEDSKKFLGTIVLNELIHAVTNRDRLPAKKRHQFCIFVDEVQNFADSKDFAVLFTQARKLGVATTIAHQERFGQLADNKPILGATDAAGNKILFTLSDEDAPKLAPEFAKRPPTEIKYEQQLGISQNPIDLLLKGHNNPQIKRFVNQYLRPMQERREDAREDIEVGRLLRMDYLDEAALYRIDESLAPRDHIDRYFALQQARHAALRAQQHTQRLLHLAQIASSVRLQFRYLNEILTAVMEGNIIPQHGNEPFCAFLTSLVGSAPGIPRRYAEALVLYIVLVYGNPAIPRSVPYAFAKTHGLLPDRCATLEKKVEAAALGERSEYLEQITQTARSRYEVFLADQTHVQRNKVKYVEKELREWRVDPSGYNLGHRDFYDWINAYILLSAYPFVYKQLEPYFTARFAPPWSKGYPGATHELDDLLRSVDSLREECLRARKYFASKKRAQAVWRKVSDQLFRSDVDEEFAPAQVYRYNKDIQYQEAVLDGFREFIGQYGEGAFATLTLLRTAGTEPERWRNYRLISPEPRGSAISKNCDKYRYPPTWKNNPYHCVDFDRYPGYNVLYVPSLQNRKPLEVLLTLEAVSDYLSGCNLAADCERFYWFGHGGNLFAKVNEKDEHGWRTQPKLLVWNFAKGRFTDRLTWGYTAVHYWSDNYHYQGWQFEEGMREDLQLLRKFLQHQPRRVELNRLAGENELVMRYLQLRACDLARYGREIADVTFPEPAISGISSAKVTQVVEWMAEHLEKARQKIEEQEREEVTEYFRNWLLKQMSEFSDIRVVKIPHSLEPCILEASQIEKIKDACIRELSQLDQAYVEAVFILVKDFAEFCRLLSLPENHIKDKTGQYVEREVPARTVRDMMDDMAAFELTRLHPHQAYAKLIQKNGGTPGVYIGKIKTLPPFPEPEWADAMDKLVAALTNETEPDEDGGHTALVNIEGKEQPLRIAPSSDWARFVTSTIELRAAVVDRMCKERALIREEIRQRQAPWRTAETLLRPRPLKGPPPTHF